MPAKKLRFPVLPDSRVYESEKYIGHGHVMIRKDLLQAGSIKRLQNLSDRYTLEETTIRNTLLDPKTGAGMVRTNVCYDFGKPAKPVVSRLWLEIDGPSHLWINTVFDHLLPAEVQRLAGPNPAVTDSAVARNVIIAVMNPKNAIDVDDLKTLLKIVDRD